MSAFCSLMAATWCVLALTDPPGSAARRESLTTAAVWTVGAIILTEMRRKNTVKGGL